MSNNTAEQEDTGLTFSDEDFERRYSPEEAIPGSARPPHPVAQQGQPVGRSRNRFMRTLLRRRLSASGAN
jgi:hypothetical protein